MTESMPSMSSIKVTLTDGLRATVQARDHVITFDEPIADGGTNAGPMPTEMLLGAIGACAAITAQLYARRKGWALDGVEIDLSRQRLKVSDYPPYDPAKHGVGDMINEIRQQMTFKGDLTDAQRARLLEIAARCPVHRILTDPVAMVDELVAAETWEPFA